MAIYHLEAKVVSRGTGRSAVAASAYLSCSKIVNDYDGVQHDYTRKKGLVWQQVFLPEYAPQEWQDRSTLWNAVEENEKTKDSRLAREFVAALADAMETLRVNMIVFRYQLRHISRGKYKLGQYLDSAKPTLTEYLTVVQKIKNTVKERKSLLEYPQSQGAECKDRRTHRRYRGVKIRKIYAAGSSELRG